MIIGHGNIANSIRHMDRDDINFFAAGVSNSSCTDKDEFERERKLMDTMNKDIHLVYFSNLGIYYKNDEYTRHKISMEEFIKDNFKSYTIVRFEVCTWVNNPTTILNVFKNKIANNEPITIQDTTRYVLTLDELIYWLKLIPVGKKNEMNVLGTKMTIQEIVDKIKEGKL